MYNSDKNKSSNKPLISYYGGKQNIAKKIVDEVDKIHHTVFVEPFFGGGAVFFKRIKPKTTNNDHYREVINDHSELLINLYRVARNNPDEFKRLIDFTPYSRAEHKLAVKICKNPNDYSDFDKAWAYYVNINMSFSKELNRGWSTGVFGGNHASVWDKKRDNIPSCLARLKDVYIECDDVLNVIKRWDSPQTLFYLDPPYPKSNQGHYGGYTIDDWNELIDLLDAIQGSYILSNYQQETEPLNHDKKVVIEVHSSSSGNGQTGKNRDKTRKTNADELGNRKREEILWIRDNSSKMREELKNISFIKKKKLKRKNEDIELFNDFEVS